jgi:hypothetical protein
MVFVCPGTILELFQRLEAQEVNQAHSLNELVLMRPFYPHLNCWMKSPARRAKFLVCSVGPGQLGFSEVFNHDFARPVPV